MNVAVLILSSSGGIISFVTGVIFVVRAILKNVGATRENTEALQDVKHTLLEMGEKVDRHTVEIAILRDRSARRLCHTKSSKMATIIK